MEIHDTRATARTPAPGPTDRVPGAGSGAGSAVLMGLAVVACPLLCVGPLLVVALASTGLVRALRDAPWPPIAAAVLVVVALGVAGTRARQTRNCCAPASTRPLGDEPTR